MKRTHDFFFVMTVVLFVTLGCGQRGENSLSGSDSEERAQFAGIPGQSILFISGETGYVPSTSGSETGSSDGGYIPDGSNDPSSDSEGDVGEAPSDSSGSENSSSGEDTASVTPPDDGGSGTDSPTLDDGNHSETGDSGSGTSTDGGTIPAENSDTSSGESGEIPDSTDVASGGETGEVPESNSGSEDPSGEDSSSSEGDTSSGSNDTASNDGGTSGSEPEWDDSASNDGGSVDSGTGGEDTASSDGGSSGSGSDSDSGSEATDDPASNEGSSDDTASNDGGSNEGATDADEVEEPSEEEEPGGSLADYCPERQGRPDVFRVKLNRVDSQCSEKNQVYFEDAIRPIFAVEARYPDANLDHNPRSDHKNYRSKLGESAYEHLQSHAAVGIFSVDLKEVDLFGPQFQQEYGAPIDWNRVDRSLTIPNGWNKVLVTFYVCDDRDNDGRCSDEMFQNQLTLRSPTFKACHLPAAIPIEVYSEKSSKIR